MSCHVILPVYIAVWAMAIYRWVYARGKGHTHIPVSKLVEMLKIKAALGQNALFLFLCFLCIAPSVNGTGAGE